MHRPERRSRLEIMAHRAYNSRSHRITRARLMKAVIASPGRVPCGICGGPLYPPASGDNRGADGIDLHHIDPLAKARGKGGDVLAHARCNRRLKSVPGKLTIKPAAVTAWGKLDRREPEPQADGRVWTDGRIW
jgi:hypothetical protein